jgi:uncharacterized protein YdeI (YjbR/CyaY-like superfamily)
LGLPNSPNGKEVLAPSSRAEWREWLRTNQDRDGGTWILVPRKAASVDGPSYADLVEEALCFGWIDGQAAKGDDSRSMLWFSPRRKGGIWARSNKERVARLEAAGLIAERGAAVIAAAKADGSWAQYDDADALVVHDDLAAALAATPGARESFDRLAPSHRKQHLWYVYEAKRPETRERRIKETVRRLLV